MGISFFKRAKVLGNRRTSKDRVFDYTGDGCSVPYDVISVRFKEGLQKIGECACIERTSLENITTIPSSVTEIGAAAFNNCHNLREVIMNEGLQKIKGLAFCNCSSLESVTLPSTVTEIGANTFCGCSNLREVTLNEGLQKIESWAFCGCSSLEIIKFPSSLVEIDNSAFGDCSNLREVIFNDGLQKIGKDAFRSCRSLESVTLLSTVVEIGDNAFHDCRNLREVALNDGLQKIGELAFLNCSSLESITLPTTVTEIDNYAFGGCINLRVVELNGVPQRLKNEAFRYCNALERFLFPTISFHLKNIIQTSHWEELEDKLNEVRGLVQWESEQLFVSRATPHNWDDIRRDLGRITRLVSYYELKEATITFELALWKFKLDQADASNTTNRAAYRMDVPGPVKDTILQYLGHN